MTDLDAQNSVKRTRVAGRIKSADRSTPRHDAWHEKVLLPALDDFGARRRLAEFLAGTGASTRSILAFQNKLTKVARREVIFNGEELLGIQDWLAANGIPARLEKQKRDGRKPGKNTYS